MLNPASPGHFTRHNSLPTFIDLDMLDDDLLHTAGAVAFESFDLGRERAGKAVEGTLVALGHCDPSVFRRANLTP